MPITINDPTFYMPRKKYVVKSISSDMFGQRDLWITNYDHENGFVVDISTSPERVRAFIFSEETTALKVAFYIEVKMGYTATVIEDVDINSIVDDLCNV